VEEEQHTQLLLCNPLRAPRGKHAAARMCACAPGNKQAALGICAKLGFTVVELEDMYTRAGHQTKFVHQKFVQ